MKICILMLAVGFGGGIGAVSRHLLSALLHGVLSVPEYVTIMIVNISGCFLIGLVFFILEGILKRDQQSRLSQSELSQELAAKGWWPAPDPTQPIIRDFKSDLRTELLAGFIITGILGGMTTFSLFSLISLNLEQGGNHLAMMINAFGSVTLGWLATYGGLLTGRKIILHYSESNH
jgi:CrcB protein